MHGTRSHNFIAKSEFFLTEKHVQYTCAVSKENLSKNFCLDYDQIKAEFAFDKPLLSSL